MNKHISISNRLAGTSVFITSAVCLLIFNGCATTPSDSTMQSDAYTLYGKVAAAYNTGFGADNYKDRAKNFYPQAYSQLDTLELRARVDTGANPDSKKDLSAVQSGLITPIQSIRHTLQNTEEADRTGSLNNYDIVVYTKKLQEEFYSL